MRTANENRQRIGLFGGTFDPVHMGHLIIADAVREQKQLERIIFIPSARPPHKGSGIMFDADARFEMLRLAINDTPYFDISDIEMRRTGPSYTIDTIREMKRHYPDHTDFFFIVGRDNLYELKTWRQPHEIIRECTILVAERICENCCDIPPEFESHVEIVDLPRIEISSTDIKARIREQRSFRYLVPANVHNYIIRHTTEH